MAALDDLRKISNNIEKINKKGNVRRDAGIADIKKTQNYDERLKTMENLRRSVYDTEKVLGQLPQDVQNRTRGRLMTAAQQNRLLSTEREPLAQTLSNLARSQDVEQQGVNQVRQMIDDFLTRDMSTEDARIRALMLKREDARAALEREMQREQMANQRAMSYSSRPSYDLGFMQDIINKQRAANKPAQPASNPLTDLFKKGLSNLPFGLNNLFKF